MIIFKAIVDTICLIHVNVRIKRNCKLQLLIMI